MAHRYSPYMRLPDHQGMPIMSTGVLPGNVAADAIADTFVKPDNLDSVPNANTSEKCPKTTGSIYSHIYRKREKSRYRLTKTTPTNWTNSDMLSVKLRRHNGTRPEIIFDARMMLSKDLPFQNQLMEQLEKLLGQAELKNFPMSLPVSTTYTKQTCGSVQNTPSKTQSS